MIEKLSSACPNQSFNNLHFSCVTFSKMVDRNHTVIKLSNVLLSRTVISSSSLTSFCHLFLADWHQISYCYSIDIEICSITIKSALQVQAEVEQKGLQCWQIGRMEVQESTVPIYDVPADQEKHATQRNTYSLFTNLLDPHQIWQQVSLLSGI